MFHEACEQSIVHVVDSVVILASLFLLQQHPGVVGRCQSRVVVVKVELVVLPPVEPLDTVVELVAKRRGVAWVVG